MPAVSTAKDIMTANPLMIGSGMDILDAVEFFNKHHITSAPVQNPLGEILGQFSELDLVKALVHYRAGSADYSKVIHSEHLFEPVFYVNDTDDIGLVMRTVLRSPSHRILVKDKKGKVVGIISPKDLLRSIQGDRATGKAASIDEVKVLQRELEDLRVKMHEMTNYLQTYDTVFQSGLFMLHSVDRDGKIVFANERIHQALGYAPGELIGKTIFDLYPASVHDEARAGLTKVVAEGRHNLIYSSMVKKDGAVIRVDLATAALRDEKGRFIGTFTISRAHGSEAMLRSLEGIFDNPSQTKSGTK